MDDPILSLGNILDFEIPDDTPDNLTSSELDTTISETSSQKQSQEAKELKLKRRNDANDAYQPIMNWPGQTDEIIEGNLIKARRLF